MVRQIGSRISPNAVITISASSTWVYNPDTGNDEAIVGQTITLIASLITDRGRNRDPEKLQPGSNRHTTYFLGRCVTPINLPDGFTEQTIAECTITEPVSGREQSGKFHFSEIFSSRHRRVQKTLGAKFRGYFIEDAGDGTQMVSA